MKDIDATKFILGMDIKRDQATRKIWLNQMKYIETIFKHFNMEDCKPVKVPILVGARIIVEQCPKTQEKIEYLKHLLEDWLLSLMSTLVMDFRPQD